MRLLQKMVGWLVVLRINVYLAIYQPYLDLEAGDNQSLKIQVARPGIEPRSSCSASQELNHSATTVPLLQKMRMNTEIKKKRTDLTQSYDKAPIPTENYEIASSNFEYTIIVN